jgi:hypothetical protein
MNTCETFKANENLHLLPSIQTNEEGKMMPRSQVNVEECRKHEMRKTGQRMSCQGVNRDKLIEGLSF